MPDTLGHGSLEPSSRTEPRVPERNVAAWQALMIPQIFESMRNRDVADGFWAYYDVDSRNVSVITQERLLRFTSDVRAFLHPEGVVLSVGCGYGLHEILLSFLAPELEIVGVDILDDQRSDAKIRSMKAIVRAVHADRVTPLLAEGGRLPFQDGMFDCVLAIDSLSHADYMRPDRDLEESQGVLLAEMWRVVRPGGQLAAIENSVVSPRNVMRKSGTMCHPVNPFYLQSALNRLGCDEVRVVPYYDLTDSRNLSGRFVGAVLKRSKAIGMLLAPLFMLSARKRTYSGP